MELIVIAVLLLVIAVVAIDAIARLDERRAGHPPRDETCISTQKIIVDLTRRR